MNDCTIHHGRNIKRFREMLGMKQDALACELGTGWSQKKVSLLEAKEKIEPELLEHVSKTLNVPKEAVENFDDAAIRDVISKTFFENFITNDRNYIFSFHPMDKVIELYERMLKEKDEMISRLERLLDRNYPGN